MTEQEFLNKHGRDKVSFVRMSRFRVTYKNNLYTITTTIDNDSDLEVEESVFSVWNEGINFSFEFNQ